MEPGPECETFGRRGRDTGCRATEWAQTPPTRSGHCRLNDGGGGEGRAMEEKKEASFQRQRPSINEEREQANKPHSGSQPERPTRDQPSAPCCGRQGSGGRWVVCGCAWVWGWCECGREWSRIRGWVWPVSAQCAVPVPEAGCSPFVSWVAEPSPDPGSQPRRQTRACIFLRLAPHRAT